MLEALIGRNTGVVIVLAPAGKSWGEFERQYFKVCQWQDPAFEGIENAVSTPYSGEGGESKWLDVSGVDLAGPEVLPWEAVEPNVRVA